VVYKFCTTIGHMPSSHPVKLTFFISNLTAVPFEPILYPIHPSILAAHSPVIPITSSRCCQKRLFLRVIELREMIDFLRVVESRSVQVQDLFISIRFNYL
jgi:hypothetical protein